MFIPTTIIYTCVFLLLVQTIFIYFNVDAKSRLLHLPAGFAIFYHDECPFVSSNAICLNV